MIQQQFAPLPRSSAREPSPPGPPPCGSSPATSCEAPGTDHARGLRSRWSAPRIARLGFLVGRGWDARRVADDPAIASTANNVHRQAQRFGLAFRDATGLRLPAEVGERIDRAAARRGLTREGLIRSIVLAAGSDDVLIDNILDDDA